MRSDTVPRPGERIRDLITDLMAAATAVSLYGDGHPRSRQRMNALHLSLVQTLEGRSGPLLMAVTGNELFVDGRPFTRSARQAGRLLQRLRHSGIEYLSFKSGASESELLVLVQALAWGTPPASRSQPHLAIGNVAYAMPGAGGAVPESRRDETGRAPAVGERVALVAEAIAALSSGSALPAEAFELVGLTIANRNDEEGSPLGQLAPWGGAATWLATHSHNVAVLASGLARMAGQTPASCFDLALAGLFHDIGKAFWPDELIERELALTGDALELVIDHPRMGLEVVLALEDLPETAAIVTYEHHLGYNAIGYPPLRQARRPHPASQLVAVADAFDVLYTARVALGSVQPEGIAPWIAARSGTLFDPGWTQAACSLLSP